jgi:ankyrin repeat protein
VDIARAILEHGVDVKAQNRRNRTPLHYARGEEVARLLLKHGADANALDIKGRTPLHLLSENGFEGAVRVLLEHGVGANTRDANDATPLHLASRPMYGRGRPDVIRLLLQYSADIHARDGEGQTPFMRATTKGDHDIMQLLLEHGAEDRRGTVCFVGPVDE